MAKNSTSSKRKKERINLNKLGVVITRSIEQSESLANWVRNNNGHPLIVPCLDIQLTDDIQQAEDVCKNKESDYDYLLFTSPNSVKFAVQLGLTFSNQLLISIGEGTSSELSKHTNLPIIQADKPYTSEALIQKLSTYDLENKKVLIFSGEGGRRILSEELLKLGVKANYVDVYKRAKPESIDLTETIEYAQKHPIVIIVTSQEAFQNYHNQAEQHDPLYLTRFLIVGSERLSTFTKSLGYHHISIAHSAATRDIINQIKLDCLSITQSFNHEELSMSQLDNIPSNQTDENTETVPVSQETPVPVKKSSNGLSKIALALALVGIGFSGFSFINSTNTLPSVESQSKEIEALKKEIQALNNSYASLSDEIKNKQTPTTEIIDLSPIEQSQKALEQRVITIENNSISSLQADSGNLKTQIDRINDNISALKNDLGKLNTDINNIGSVAKNSEEKTYTLQNQFTEKLLEVNNKIATMKSVEERIKATSDLNLLNLNQVDYLLKLADYKLRFENEIPVAISALTDAKQILMSIDNRNFIDTITRIQDQIIKLGDIKTPDYSKDVLELIKIRGMIPSLKTKSDTVIDNLKGAFVTNEPEEQANLTWYQNVLNKIKPFFIVTRERATEPVLMKVEDQDLIKQQVQLQLSMANLSLIQNQPEIYQSTLKEAKQLLDKYFDPNDENLHYALQKINQLMTVDFTHESMDITALLKSFNVALQLYKGE